MRFAALVLCCCLSGCLPPAAGRYEMTSVVVDEQVLLFDSATGQFHWQVVPEPPTEL
jgi:hypothetical protein